MSANVFRPPDNFVPTRGLRRLPDHLAMPANLDDEVRRCGLPPRIVAPCGRGAAG